MGAKAKALSWEPVRRGDIYCAPACGGKCTYAAYTLAMRRAEDVVQKLGRGWIIRVHENLGWHSSVRGVNGHMNVSIHHYGSKPSYTAFLNTEVSVAGKWAVDASTPEAAVRAVREAFEAERMKYEKLHERLMKGFR